MPILLITLLVTLSFSIISETALIVLCFLNWNKSKSFPQQMLHCREWDSARTACHVDSSHCQWDFICLIWSTWPEHITSLWAAGNAFGREGGKMKYLWTEEKVIIPLGSIRIQTVQCFHFDRQKSIRQIWYDTIYEWHFTHHAILENILYNLPLCWDVLSWFFLFFYFLFL